VLKNCFGSLSRDTVPLPDFKSLTYNFISSQWQHQWDRESNNKLHNIQPEIGTTVQTQNFSRPQERVLHRTRIGHTHFTHCHLLKREDAPQCIPCDCPLTVEHILLQCVEFDLIRPQYFKVSSMFELFHTVSERNILELLKVIQLFNKF